MEEFLSDTTIHGIEFFECKNKKIRKSGKFVFFIAFCGLGYYIFNIYTKFQIEPLLNENINVEGSHQFPYPAVTICSPIFSRDQSPNLYEILRNQKSNLMVKNRKSLAANVQACALHLGEKLSKIYPGIDESDTAQILREKFHDISDSIAVCLFQSTYTKCERMLNYVLTDYGFCFSYNIQGFDQIFNSNLISKDFSYKRTKIAKTYWKASMGYEAIHKEPYERIDDDSDEVQWTLRDGYLNSTEVIQPSRAVHINDFGIYPFLNKSDLSNLCPEREKSFSIFLHYPNEILTPFDEPIHLKVETTKTAYLALESFEMDDEFRRYPPQTRGCYFENEKPLKFFKSYTKFLCEFECLANQTLESCGCVKFSMPRNDSTPICGLNKTSCYLKVWKDWSKISPSCNCLQSCSQIKYEIRHAWSVNKFFDSSSVKFTSRNESLYSRIIFYVDDTYVTKRTYQSSYTFYAVFADFGSVLGIFFGCSVLSVLEVFYFLAMKLLKIKSQFKSEIHKAQEASEFAAECTVHGIQFIFDGRRRKFVRIFWIFAFLISLSGCIYNARGNYIKMMIEPEIKTVLNSKSVREIPFPKIKIRDYIFAKNGLANFSRTISDLKNRRNLNISDEGVKYFAANLLRFAPNMMNEMDTATNFSKNFNVVEFMDRSQFTIDELMFDCELSKRKIPCSKIFKRVLSHNGFAYTFNQVNFHSLLNDEVSSDFDSYGRGLQKNLQWSLDKGYVTEDDEVYPHRASEEIIVSLKISKQDAPNDVDDAQKFVIEFGKPNDMESTEKLIYVKFGEEKTLTFGAKVSTFKEEFLKFSPEKRGCYFTHEKKLRYFKTYSEENCLYECLANVTYFCPFLNVTFGKDCTKFSFPRNNSMRVCLSSQEAFCQHLVSNLFPAIKSVSIPPCRCLKTCNDVKYTLMKETRGILGESKLSKNESFLVTRIKFEFVKGFVEESVNIVGYGFKEFMTDVGGLLGLFLGCSTVSLVEVIYHPIAALWRKFKSND